MKTTIILICFISVGLAQGLDNRVIFQRVDSNADGQVSVEEFQTKYDTIDTNGDERVTLDEFIKATTRPFTREQKIVTFNFYDKDHDGSWTRDADVRLFIESVDSNNDAMINFDEFDSYITELRELRSHADTTV